MDLNKLGQMLGLGCGGFLVEDAIFLKEKAKDFLRSRLGFNGDPMLNLIPRCVGKPHLCVRDFMQLPIRDYVIEIVSCLKSVLGVKKVNLIKRSSELYEFIDKVSIEIHEIHTDLNDATHGFHL